MEDTVQDAVQDTGVHFHYPRKPRLFLPKEEQAIAKWLVQIAKKEQQRLKTWEIIFCTRKKLLVAQSAISSSSYAYRYSHL